MNWWVDLGLAAVGLAFLGLAYLGIQLGRRWDDLTAAKRVWWKRAAFGFLSAVTYLAAGLVALFGVVGTIFGAVSLVGGLAGWSTKSQGAIAGWLTIAIVGIPTFFYIFSGFWKDYLRHLLPGAVQGSVTLEPGPTVDADRLRKSWSRAEVLSPVAVSLSVWFFVGAIAPALVEPSLPVWGFALLVALLLLTLFMGVSPRFWQAHQYKRGFVRRTHAGSPPADDILNDVILPRALVTPIVGMAFASLIVKALDLPSFWSGIPLWTLATPIMLPFITFPLILESKKDDSDPTGTENSES